MFSTLIKINQNSHFTLQSSDLNQKIHESAAKSRSKLNNDQIRDVVTIFITKYSEMML